MIWFLCNFVCIQKEEKAKTVSVYIKEIREGLQNTSHRGDHLICCSGLRLLVGHIFLPWKKTFIKGEMTIFRYLVDLSRIAFLFTFMTTSTHFYCNEKSRGPSWPRHLYFRGVWVFWLCPLCCQHSLRPPPTGPQFIWQSGKCISWVCLCNTL